MTCVRPATAQKYDLVVKAEKIEGMPQVPGKRATLQQWYEVENRNKRVALLDEENNGYTL